MKTYEVSGPFAFRAHAPGSTFRADPDPVIDRALSRGSIAEVATPDPASAPKPTAHAAPKSKEDTK